MSRRIKIPGIDDVAKHLRLKPPGEHNGIKGTILHTPSGVKIQVNREGRGYRYFSAVAVVFETSDYPTTRRKVYLYRGASISREFDKVIARPLTDDEKKKIKEKYAEMRGIQKSINECRKSREQESDAKQEARESLQNALDEAGIDEYGDGDVEGLYIYTDKPHISIGLSGKSPQQVVNIYRAVKKVLQAV